MRLNLAASLAILFTASSLLSANAATAPASSSGGAAGGEVVSENKCDINDILAQFESKGAGGYQAENKYGYIGKYQMGGSALTDLGYKKDGRWTGKDGIYSKEDFKNNGAIQEKAQGEWVNLLKSRMSGLGAASHLGQTMGSCGKPVTESGMIMGAHLVGPGGASDYMKSGGFCGKKGQVSSSGYRLQYNTTDANGTCAGKYICAGSGCEVITKDMNKKTCDVVMPMIENLDCQNLPFSIRGFCNTNRPYLMTRSECEAAEAQSEKAEKGPNKEQCENMSFGSGSGSWSYVLACSYAGDFVADQDGKENPQGPVSDPACIEKLRGRGIDFKVLGQHNFSSKGMSCLVENAIQYSGGSVPFPNTVIMTCELANAMEDWSVKLKGMGVTSFGSVQTLGCRPMQTKFGVTKGSISEHAYGRAADIFSIVVGGKRISLDDVNRPLTPTGVIATQAKQAACSSFRQVLSPTWRGYKGTYGHFHVEWGKGKGCF